MFNQHVFRSRITDVNLVKLRLTADLTPKLVDLELRDIPDKCKFEVIVPTLKNIWIHHFRAERTSCINDMLAAATELEIFESYKLWVLEDLHFASNHLKYIDLWRSDNLPGISLWTPNLEKLSLRACYSIKNIEILKSHQLAEMLPEGHKPTIFRVYTANANISPKAMKALKRSGRCLVEDYDSDEDPTKAEAMEGTEAMNKFMGKFQEDYDEDDGPLGMVDAMNAWNMKQFEDM